MKKLTLILFLTFMAGACRNSPINVAERQTDPVPVLSTPVVRDLPATTASTAVPVATEAPAIPATATTASVPANVNTHGETAVVPTSTAPPPVDELTLVVQDFPEIASTVADLEGLPLQDFFAASYDALLLRDPEGITHAGLADYFGVRNDRLTDISPAFVAETQALEIALLILLQRYDVHELSPEDQISYDVYHWYLTDVVAGHEFAYSDYPVSFFITSVHQDLVQLFTDIHPITDQADVEDYIARLGQVDVKLDQLVAALTIREEAGVILPAFAVQWTLPEIRQLAGDTPQNSPFYTTLVQKMALLSSINPAAQEVFLAEAEEAIARSVLPGFAVLRDTLARQAGVATEDAGVWKLPNGPAYYRYTLRHHTTTEMSAAEIHALGLAEVERIQGEMRLLFAELGYPDNESLPQLIGRVAQDGGTVFGDEIVAEYEALIVEAQANVGGAFDLRPQAEVIVIGVPQGGYYRRPAVDGSRPGAFYATATGSEARFSMPTLAYHEAVPGHHFQIGIMQELRNMPAFRNGVTFTAYVEGWALYAELLAHELGFYADDPYGNIGSLQGELFRAVRLVVDTGIHDQQWTFAEAVAYMVENTGFPRRMVEGQIARYIVWPGQAVSYKIGMLKIVSLRDKAQAELGEAFDLRAFHNVVLANGSLPLEVLERVVDEYIAAVKTG